MKIINKNMSIVLLYVIICPLNGYIHWISSLSSSETDESAILLFSAIHVRRAPLCACFRVTVSDVDVCNSPEWPGMQDKVNL